jgi:hypothetical protein
MALTLSSATLSPSAINSRNVKNEWGWALQNENRLLLLPVVPYVIPHRYVSINVIDATASGPCAPTSSAGRSALGT